MATPNYGYEKRQKELAKKKKKEEKLKSKAVRKVNGDGTDGDVETSEDGAPAADAEPSSDTSAT
ncbi:MAG: hypothetical protein U5M53_01015 [Rhodoferax sp.]|nr:hypothetical protein [Rhodoferax sp.]